MIIVFSVTNSICLAQYYLQTACVVSPTQNDVTLTLFDTPCKQYTIIQIHNNVLWDLQ